MIDPLALDTTRAATTALADCPSDGGAAGIRASLREDAALIDWLVADPARTTGARL